MGIPYYFYVITQRHPGILKSQPTVPCGRFFLDFNGAIHPAAQQILGSASANAASATESAVLEKAILANIWKYFLELVTQAQPTEGVSICIDGVAPRAKMFQQRKRRYLSTYRHRRLAAMGAAPAITWDTNAITPGTPFMKRLHASLRAHIRHFVVKDGRPVALSTADEAGEGEHKIFMKLAQTPVDPERSTVIYGLDADLIMLSLLSHRPNVYLLREVTHVRGAPPPADNAPAYIYLDVDALRRGVLSEMRSGGWQMGNAGSNPVDDIYGDEAKNLIENYAVMCFFLGNDFLPHLVTVHLKKQGLEQLLRAAKNVWNTQGPWIGADGAMDIGRMTAILEALAVTEDATLRELVEEYAKRRPWANNDAERLESYPLLPENKDPLAAALLYDAPDKWRPLYYKHLYGTRLHDTTMVMRACELYWQGVQWTWAYYTRRPRDPTWFYPYAYAPSIRDLTTNVPSTEELEAVKKQDAASPTHAVDSAIQLLAVLPRESRALMPEAVQKLLDDPTFGCAYLYPSTYAIRTFLRTRLWECDPVLPHFNVPLLEATVAALKTGEKNV